MDVGDGGVARSDLGIPGIGDGGGVRWETARMEPEKREKSGGLKRYWQLCVICQLVGGQNSPIKMVDEGENRTNSFFLSSREVQRKVEHGFLFLKRSKIRVRISFHKYSLHLF